MVGTLIGNLDILRDGGLGQLIESCEDGPNMSN